MNISLTNLTNEYLIIPNSIYNIEWYGFNNILRLDYILNIEIHGIIMDLYNIFRYKYF